MLSDAVVGVVREPIAGRDAVLLGLKNDQGLLAREWGCLGEKLEPADNSNHAVAIWRMGLQEISAPLQRGELVAVATMPEGRRVWWYECRLADPADRYRIQPGSDLVAACWYPLESVRAVTGPVSRSRWPAEVRAYFGRRG